MQIEWNKKGEAESLETKHYLYVGCGENQVTVPYLVFPGLEQTGIVKHLFTTRLGGVSSGEFASLNLSYTRGDDKACVDENYRRVAAVLGCEAGDMVCSDQTHTANVRRVTAQDKGKGVVIPRDYTDVDGLITNERGVALATFYADCVPLYMVDTENKAIGLSHSGWRGTVQRIGAVTLQEMAKAYGTKPSDVRVAIGPSICQDCYEVSKDVAEEFDKEFSTAVDYVKEFAKRGLGENLFYEKSNGKYQLNLWFANYIVFREAGVLDEQIEITDVCTCCNSELLFSHRASQGRRGNLGAFLVLCDD
ncbi:MAG: peptidoglycan editing factor PgeF [Lachnospiraceae bacterium]|nr:peptidoglycan editing factor PgeF [Lachnospiraceae bacterium]